MNISRPPIPLPSQSRKNNHVEVGSGKVSREKSRKSVKNGVTLARDHSIRFDKQYQEKHLIVKPGIPMSSSKNLNSTKSLQQTTVADNKSVIPVSSKTYNILQEASMTNTKVTSPTMVSTTYKPVLNEKIGSMTSLDQRNRSVDRRSREK